MYKIRREKFTKLVDKHPNQEELAEELGVSAGYISHLKTGYRPITEKTARKFEKKLRLDPGYFDTADYIDGEVICPILPAPGNAEPAPAPSAISQRIPLLTWIRAGDFCESGQYTADDAEDWLPEPPWKCGNRCFALTVRGDSMSTPEGYQEGEIVYIDPDVNATPGRDVLAYYDGKATLKRLKEDEHGRYLLQLNGNIIIRPQGDWHVCGVVIFSGRKR